MAYPEDMDDNEWKLFLLKWSPYRDRLNELLHDLTLFFMEIIQNRLCFTEWKIVFLIICKRNIGVAVDFDLQANFVRLLYFVIS